LIIRLPLCFRNQGADWTSGYTLTTGFTFGPVTKEGNFDAIASTYQLKGTDTMNILASADTNFTKDASIRVVVEEWI